VTALRGAGISVDVPTGWEGAIADGRFRPLGSGSADPTLMHLASFPLPEGRGTFGAGAVDVMTSQDALVVLLEYGPESVGTPLFSAEGIPHPLDPGLFTPNGLQYGRRGQSGLQQFFTHRGRAFCLYVVLGSHIDRVDLVARVNAVLGTLDIR
jgi:hypothetical protein